MKKEDAILKQSSDHNLLCDAKQLLQFTDNQELPLPINSAEMLKIKSEPGLGVVRISELLLSAKEE